MGFEHAACAAVLFAGAFALAPAAHARARLTDAQVRQRIIEASIADYPGNCPCPYNVARNGSRCGRRSAWNRAGGYGPRCFPGDVTQADVRTWRAGR